MYAKLDMHYVLRHAFHTNLQQGRQKGREKNEPNQYCQEQRAIWEELKLQKQLGFSSIRVKTLNLSLKLIPPCNSKSSTNLLIIHKKDLYE